MATYVLIHGAAHGGWCWKKVVPLLEAEGHRVLAPDLLGLGDDPTPIDTLNLDLWVDHVTALVSAQPEPVVLVGHSRGGIIVSAVTERVPDKVARAVYLTAFLLKDGQTIMDEAALDVDSVIPTNIVLNEAEGTWTIRKEVVVDGFYGDCSPEDLDFTFPRLRPEPIFSVFTPVRVTSERFGRVKRHYIECVNDNAITIAAQRRMQSAWPCDRVFALETSHSPFYSAPDQVAQCLMEKDKA